MTANSLTNVSLTQRMASDTQRRPIVRLKAMKASVPMTLWAMLIGFVAGSIIGMVLLAIRRRSKQIPFGPFLALGAVVAVLLSSGLVTQG